MSNEDWFYIFDELSKKSPVDSSAIRKIFSDNIAGPLTEWRLNRQNSQKQRETAVKPQKQAVTFW